MIEWSSRLNRIKPGRELRLHARHTLPNLSLQSKKPSGILMAFGTFDYYSRAL